jgi:hypothetical protein
MQEIRDDIRANRFALDAQVLDLQPSLTSIRQSLATLDERSSAIDAKLNTLRRGLTANGQPIDLNERLNTIDTNAADCSTRPG